MEIRRSKLVGETSAHSLSSYIMYSLVLLEWDQKVSKHLGQWEGKSGCDDFDFK